MTSINRPHMLLQLEWTDNLVQKYCIINILEMPRIKGNTIIIREAIMVECPGEMIRVSSANRRVAQSTSCLAQLAV